MSSLKTRNKKPGAPFKNPKSGRRKSITVRLDSRSIAILDKSRTDMGMSKGELIDAALSFYANY